MTPHRLLTTAINPALAELELQGIPQNVNAARFLLTIALQESGLRYRRQVLAGGQEIGAAVSYFQFEKGGGCVGVMTHKAVASKMINICGAYDVAPTASALWEAMRYNDIVAACAARLLIYTLPGKLPATAEEGWQQYIAAWRPGKPHPKTWQGHWHTATLAVGLKP
jgi:hypothetical protein